MDWNFLLVIAALAVFLFWMTQIIDLLGRGDADFPGSHDKVVWIIVLIFLPFIGALLYFGLKPRCANRLARAREIPQEPIRCLRCGKEMPAGETKCAACGWSYGAERAEPA